MGDPFRDSLNVDPHRDIYDYWRRVAPTAGLPGRQHILPEDIPRLLPYLYLRDVVRDGVDIRFRTRLMGTRLVEVLGRDTTGRFMEDVFDPETVARQRDAYLGVIESRAPELRLINSPVTDKQHIRYERLLLPLAGDGKTIDMLLGMIWFVIRE